MTQRRNHLAQNFNQLSPSLWTTQSKFYFTNSGVFISGENAYLVDPGMSLDELETIASFLVQHGVSPKLLVLTHSHWDHLLGPTYFSGIKTIAQANYMGVFSDVRQVYIQQRVSRWRTKYSVAFAPLFNVPLPTNTFDHTTVITDDNLELNLHHAPGHTDDLLVIYHSKYATLWASDMLSNIEIPLIGYSLDAYQNTLSMLSEWEIDILIPGHGDYVVGTKEITNRIFADSAYLSELKDRITTAISKGKTLDETTEICSDMYYRNPDENTDSHLLNIEKVYVELGGVSDQKEIGWEQLRLESI